MDKIEARLKELNIILPRPPKAVANYLPGVKVREILFVAGTIGTIVGPNDEDILPIKGKLGKDLTIREGYQSARLTAINLLAMIKSVIGELDNVVRIVKMIGFVNSAPGFRDAPWVLDGASDLLVEVFGTERGKHARAALYQNELTYDAPIEIEMTVQVKWQIEAKTKKFETSAGHSLYMYCSDVAAILAGREIFGIPKKFADIEFIETEIGVSAVVRRNAVELVKMGFCFSSPEITQPGELLEVEKMNRQRIMLKVIPKAEESRTALRQVVLRDTARQVKSRRPGNAAVVLGELPSDPLKMLGVNRILGATFSLSSYGGGLKVETRKVLANLEWKKTL